jgi:hypothetical protein
LNPIKSYEKPFKSQHPRNCAIAQRLFTFSPRSLCQLSPAFQQLRSKLLALQTALQFNSLAPRNGKLMEQIQIERWKTLEEQKTVEKHDAKTMKTRGNRAVTSTERRKWHEKL